MKSTISLAISFLGLFSIGFSSFSYSAPAPYWQDASQRFFFGAPGSNRSPLCPTNSGPATNPANLNVTCLARESNSIATITVKPKSATTATASVKLSVRNVSGNVIERPYRLAFLGLPANVKLRNAKYQSNNIAYLDLDYIAGDAIQSMATEKQFVVNFDSGANKEFSFKLAIYIPEDMPLLTEFRKTAVAGEFTYGYETHVRENTPNNYAGALKYITVSRSADNGVTWGKPKIILTVDDLVNNGDRTTEDFSITALESQKWFTCPGTGKRAIYTKRHSRGINGEFTPTKDLLRAVITNPNGEPDHPHTDSVVVGKPYGLTSGDLGDFNNGTTKYIVTAESDEIMILQLKADCTDVVTTADNQPLMRRKWFNADGSVDKREAPSIFWLGGRWYLHTSEKTGWRPNQHKYSVATGLAGPWSDLKLIGDKTGYHSQVFFVGSHGASDGFGKSTKLFNGSRNQGAVPGGLGTHGGVRLPIYANAQGELATAYYDEITQNADGTVTGIQRDYGQKISIASAKITGDASANPANLIDNNLNTSWTTNNATHKVLTFDLGANRLVKALKVRNFNFANQWNNYLSNYKIEVGDGNNWTTVWDQYILTFSWLQPLDIADTNGRYVRFTHKTTWRMNNNNAVNDWGFYEVEAWGGDAWTGYSVNENFQNNNLDGWIVEKTGTATMDLILEGSNQIARLTDSDSNGRAALTREFHPQTGSEVKALIKFNWGKLGENEFIRLKGKGEVVVELVNSSSANGLALTRANGKVVTIAEFNPNTWHDLDIRVNVDAGTYDVRLDGNVVWGGEPFRVPVSQIDTVMVGTENISTNAVAHFDDIQLKGPITPPGASNSSSAAASSEPASSIAASSEAIASSTPASSEPTSSIAASSHTTSSTPASSKPASSIPASSKAASSMSVCPKLRFVPWDTRTELIVDNSTCITFAHDLAGKNLQVWDSDTNRSCDYRGTLTSVRGEGSVTINSNYVTASNLSGSIFRFNGTCNYVKVRAY